MELSVYTPLIYLAGVALTAVLCYYAYKAF